MTDAQHVRRGRARVRRPMARLAAWSLVVVLVLWLAATAVLLLIARSHTLDGVDVLERARDELTASALLGGDGADVLARAARRFDEAHRAADHALLRPWSAVPLLGSNVRSVEVLTQAATRVSRIGHGAARDLAAILDRPVTTDTDRVAQLRDVQEVAGRAARQLDRVDLGSDFFLVGPFGDARRQFAARLAELRDAVGDAGTVAAGLAQLMTGPRRYLIVAANNAEMRGGSGMWLSTGTATFVDGAFSIGDLRPAADGNLPAGAVEAPPDYEELWGWLHGTREWRNLEPSPRFAVNAELAARMWQASTGQAVDGVLVVDPVALQALLAAQGPVEVGGRVFSASDLVDFLLLGQYAALGATSGDQAGRRDQLSSLARAAVGTLQDRAWNTAGLVEQLAAVGRGRHVLAWSRDPTEQAAWRAAGIDGTLTADSLAVSLLNVGANKLDQFLRVDARLVVDERDGGGQRATIHLTLRNEAPAGLGPYVAGPTASTGLAEAEYGGVLVVNGPGSGALPTVGGDLPTMSGGRDGPTKVRAVAGVRVPRGATVELTVRILLPEGDRSLRIEPSARVPTIRWRFGDRRWVDDHVEHVEW